MSLISLIAAVDKNGGLGKENKLLCHLPADLKYFKEKTLGKPIIMGRKTFESIGKALPGRQNIILSQTMQAKENIQVVSDITQAITLTKDQPEIMVIGGAQVYKECLALANRIYLTIIDATFDADVYFPQLKADDWQKKLLGEKPKDPQNQYNLSFYQFDRLS